MKEIDFDLLSKSFQADLAKQDQAALIELGDEWHDFVSGGILEYQ